ncbi:MAG: hypothetical protein V2A78_07195 [bacterium]
MPKIMGISSKSRIGFPESRQRQVKWLNYVSSLLGELQYSDKKNESTDYAERKGRMGEYPRQPRTR